MFSHVVSHYSQSSISKSVPKTYVVDFSYLSVGRIADVLKTKPRSGTIYVKRESAAEQQQREAANKQSSAASFGDILKQQQMNDMKYTFGEGQGRREGKTQVTEDGVVVIQARDENYVFKQTDDTVYQNDADMKNWEVGQDGELVRKKLTAKEELEAVEAKRTLYRCSTLKLNNNGMTSLEQLSRALRLTLYRPAQHLAVLDLSCNALVSLPEEFGSEYPLHTLLLHQNKLTEVAEVKKLVSLSKTLRNLTLFDNPLQRNAIGKCPDIGTRRYRLLVQWILPFLTMLDDVRITPTDRDKLQPFMGMFLSKKERDILAAKTAPRGSVA